MIKANIDNEEDLDEYVEQILDMQRKKAKREEAQFQQKNDAWKEIQ